MTHDIETRKREQDAFIAKPYVGLTPSASHVSLADQIRVQNKRNDDAKKESIRQSQARIDALKGTSFGSSLSGISNTRGLECQFFCSTSLDETLFVSSGRMCSSFC